MRRILVIDDSRSVRMELESYLEPYGFEVEHADNGAVALSKMSQAVQAPFDLLFLDLHMPVLDGPSFLRMMRQRGFDTKVVVITSGAETAVLTSTIKLGASDFVSKPFQSEQIRAAIARVMGIDLSATVVERPRVLVQDPDPGAGQLLQVLLPPHVDVEGVREPAAALEAVGRSTYQLVLLSQGASPGDATAAGVALRQAAPYAGLFLTAPAETTPDGMRRLPRGPFDGVLPKPLDQGTAKDFVYSNFLRPLAFIDRNRLVLAGFRGNEEDQTAYFLQATRSLQAKVDSLVGETPSISVDLRRAPLDRDWLPRLVAAVQDHIQQLEIDALFTVTRDMQEILSGRAESSTAVLSIA